MDEATCYVFKSKRDRPVKRRRLNDEGADVERARRQRLFEREWQALDARLLNALNSTHDATLNEVSTFINTAKDIRGADKVPTGLITTGLGAAGSSIDRIVSHSLQGGRNVCVSLTPADAPNLKTLVKTLISRITQDSADESDEESRQLAARGKGTHLLKYDLQILYEWLAGRDGENVIVALRDSEAFDINVLTDFIILLRTWLYRIPFVLLVGIATSLEVFQDRLPSSAIKCVRGTMFDVTETDEVVEQAFKCCTAADGATLHLGPDLARSLSQRNHDYIQSVEAFRQSVKYAYMSHCYGNSLSVFGMDTKIEDLQDLDFEAMRNLPSFRQYMEQLLDRKQAAKARRLLKSNEALVEDLWDALIIANTNLEWLCGALSIVKQIQDAGSDKVSGRRAQPYSTLYVKALSGSLNVSSPSTRELLLNIKKLDSEVAESLILYIADTLISMPPSTHDISPDSFSDLHDELSDLVRQHGPLKPPSFLNPGRTTSASSLSSKSSTTKPRTPSKTPATTTSVPPHLRTYTSLLTRLHDLLKFYFTCTLPPIPFNHPDFFLPSSADSASAPTTPATPATKPNPQWNPTELLFLTTPHRTLLTSAQTPSPRRAIERALSRPHDYLACTCCAPNVANPDEGGPSAKAAPTPQQRKDTQPPTAILYQLYLESGTLINMADLWTAFRARVAPSVGAATLVNGSRDPSRGDPDVASVGSGTAQVAVNSDDEEQAKTTRALFTRGLAELKYLGMIRPTRRKNDCVMKVLWGGL